MCKNLSIFFFFFSCPPPQECTATAICIRGRVLFIHQAMRVVLIAVCHSYHHINELPLLLDVGGWGLAVLLPFQVHLFNGLFFLCVSMKDSQSSADSEGGCVLRRVNEMHISSGSFCLGSWLAKEMKRRKRLDGKLIKCFNNLFVY